MAAPVGNQFWKLNKNPGSDTKFETPDELWESCVKYFDWANENPIKEEKVFHFQGSVTKTEVNKVRAFTLKALCLHLGVNSNYFTDFKDRIAKKDSEESENDTPERKERRKAFARIIDKIYDVIFTQKFENAAADQLNHNIIALELGLARKEQVEVSHKTPIELKAAPGVDLDDLLKE